MITIEDLKILLNVLNQANFKGEELDVAFNLKQKLINTINSFYTAPLEKTDEAAAPQVDNTKKEKKQKK